MAVESLIECAESLLPGTPAPDSEDDPRWQAILRISEYVESHPEEIWAFVLRWGRHEDEDLRAAVATVLLEHLLEHHFAVIFPRVSSEAMANEYFADTFRRCWKFGLAERPENSRQFDALVAEARKRWSI
jgi:hypothetical protein